MPISSLPSYLRVPLTRSEHNNYKDSTTPKNPKLKDEYLLLLFMLINESHFNNEVPNCRIKWSERIGIGKQCNRLSDFTVFEDEGFSPVIRLSKNLLLNQDNYKISVVLFYAMIHVWLWSKKKPWGQTEEFRQKAATFNFELFSEQLSIAEEQKAQLAEANSIELKKMSVITV